MSFDNLAHNRKVFAPIQQALSKGDLDQAKAFLTERKGQKRLAFDSLFEAIVLHETELHYWERAIDALSKCPPCSERLFALERAIALSRAGGDDIRVRGFLQLAQSIAGELGDAKQHLEYLAMYANQLYLDGYIQKGKGLLEDVITQAVSQEHWLLVVSQATILSGVLLQEQDWVGAASLSVIMEEAAIKRENWVGVACAVMTRASAWFAQGKEEASIRLLLETGRMFHARGFVAALHLIKARLAELRALLGEERFNALCDLV